MLRAKQFIQTGLLILACSVLLTACGVSSKDFDALNPKDSTIEVIQIPSGSTPKSIGALLESHQLIKNAEAFVAKVKEKEVAADLKAGEYGLSPSMTVDQMVDAIASGKVHRNTVKVVIPEGFEVRQILERLVKDGLGTEEAFKEVLKNDAFEYPFLQGVNRDTLLEGYLFPATYEFEKTATPHEIVDQMLKAFNRNFSSEYFEQAKKMNLSVSDIVTLASIIEREAQVDDERPIVSSVFHNRLKINMRLQSCATVQYVLGERKAVLSIADTKIKSPYNTYQHKGLPPAPIASPGLESIKAALYPAETEYLYFVTTNNGDGSHYFSKTLEEHNAAIKKSKK